MNVDLDLHHVHTNQCWWDHRKPGWVCPPAGSVLAPLDLGVRPEGVVPAQPADPFTPAAPVA